MDEPIEPIKAAEVDELQAMADMAERRNRAALAEIFNHDYVASCNFTLTDDHPAAQLVLVIGSRRYPLVTLNVPEGVGGTVLIDKIHVHGWHKRQAD